MIYRKFKDIELSVLGMGAMRLPLLDPKDGSRLDDSKAHPIIDKAYEMGINYFDTAHVYNGGDSERCLGACLKKYPRDSFYLATKFNIDACDDYKGMFEKQLERLQTDHVDFYLIHCITDGNFEKYCASGCFDYFEEQKRKGRITYLGFSSHASPATLEKMVNIREWDFAQIQMNYLDWEFSSTKEEYEILHSRNIPMVIMESVRGGKLADLGDELNGRLKSREPEKSVASWALRWLMAKDGIQVMLSGMSTVEQVEDNCKTYRKEDPLTEEECAFMKQVALDLKASLTVPCTACHYCTPECPMHIEIPDIIKVYNSFKFNGWYDAGTIARISEEGQPEHCIACKKCMKHCPQSIEIPKFMKEVAEIKAKRK